MNPIAGLKTRIRAIIIDALKRAKEENRLILDDIPEFVIEVPKEKDHGDFACNVAMLLARMERKAPKEIAAAIIACMETNEMIELERVETAGAGFINFRLYNDWLYSVPVMVCRLGGDYGRLPRIDTKIQVEFVSANPTGNLHMGNARGGALGDSLANLLDWAGYSVAREFYINDAGNQIALFQKSLEARYLQLQGQDIALPEDAYAGQDVIDAVKKVSLDNKTLLENLAPEDRGPALLDFALQDRIKYIKNTLSRFGVEYDIWFSEKELHDSGKIQATLEKLRQGDFIYQFEDACWFKSTLFADEKDEVLVRANGIPTYYAADIAYHQDKFERGFDKVINIWGADHHGHVMRMKGAMQALGYDPDRLEIILMQLVHLYRDKELVRMSKRTGTTVSLDELLDEVGVDAARFSFVLRSPDSHLDFDLELAKQKKLENPVYYVQYAHARICSVFRAAAAFGLKAIKEEDIDARLLKEPEELEMLRKVADFPEEIWQAAQNYAPHRIARYVLDLAGLFHSYYNRHRVLNDNAALQDARLLLLKIIKTSIHNALQIIGVGAPEQM